MRLRITSGFAAAFGALIFASSHAYAGDPNATTQANVVLAAPVQPSAPVAATTENVAAKARESVQAVPTVAPSSAIAVPSNHVAAVASTEPANSGYKNSRTVDDPALAVPSAVDTESTASDDKNPHGESSHDHGQSHVADNSHHDTEEKHDRDAAAQAARDEQAQAQQMADAAIQSSQNDPTSTSSHSSCDGFDPNATGSAETETDPGTTHYTMDDLIDSSRSLRPAPPDATHHGMDAF